MTAVPDETDIAEITIGTDGRIYVFGTSDRLLELLRDLNPADGHIRTLLQQLGPPGPADAAAAEIR